MKRLTIVLTVIFAIGGTAAVSLATNNTENEVGQVDLAEIDTDPTTANLDGEVTDKSLTKGKETNEEARISADEAVAIAQAELDGKLGDIELDTEDGRLVYEIELEYEGDDYDFKVDAYTGEIIKIDDDLLNTSISDDVSISVQEAKNIIKELIPDGKIDDIELEKKEGRYVYEIDVDYRDEDGDIYIDAETGEVLKIEDDLAIFLDHVEATSELESYDKPHADGERISYEKAKKIALDYVGQGYVDDIELEVEKGMLLFEVEVESNNGDVDVYIDAYTGDVAHVD
ncbi:PepSY domain-containing protein [Salipaludibacillus agaradhaerens]|uniref:PepSY domain-containing protein n=1 Tax=Salipaludibacillus agaradhaerens TaxID=76935 RepID=UPI002150F320|nr:PepSY domain-containing protein [Salipaludibacillus agaradhaerens]MCR6105257.1 PepSY domain-containing protein [Salipaludibacillus agaradhaerens]MCR6117299.1 PepSY domain-containing protein [Salipaludibacillus agaradhaerens]